MKFIIILGLMVSFVSCGTDRTINNSTITKTTVVKSRFDNSRQNCIIVDVVNSQGTDIKIRCAGDSNSEWVNSLHYEPINSQPYTPNIEQIGQLSASQYDAVKNRIRKELKLETTKSIPKELLELKCTIGEITRIDREIKFDHIQVDRFKDGEICTIKKVSLKYE